MDISISEAYNRLSSLLKQVEKGPIRIHRRGETVAVIVSPEEYENLRQAELLSECFAPTVIMKGEIYGI